MDREEARQLAEAHLPDEVVALPDSVQACDFGFYFATSSRAYQESKRIEDLLVGSCGVLVDRTNGLVHDLGSAFPPEYWFETYRRRLNIPSTVVVTDVRSRRRAAKALLPLQMSFIIPEEEHGTIWRVAQHYDLKAIRKKLKVLPARFEDQDLTFRLNEIEELEKNEALVVAIEPAGDVALSDLGSTEGASGV